MVNGREFDQAIAELKKIAADNPAFALEHQYLAKAYWGKRMYPQAIEELKAFGQSTGDPHDVEFAAALDQGYKAGGWKEALKQGHRGPAGAAQERILLSVRHRRNVCRPRRQGSGFLLARHCLSRARSTDQSEHRFPARSPPLRPALRRTGTQGRSPASVKAAVALPKLHIRTRNYRNLGQNRQPSAHAVRRATHRLVNRVSNRKPTPNVTPKSFVRGCARPGRSPDRPSTETTWTKSRQVVHLPVRISSPRPRTS